MSNQKNVQTGTETSLKKHAQNTNSASKIWWILVF